jgi:phage FluMu gp28-like protein
VEDETRFKIACKARQIGFTFAAAWRVVDKRLGEPGLTVWLSASERQALEAMEHIRRFCRELKAAAVYEEEFIEGALVKQHQVRLPNGSRIVALPANPDTVRGFAGDVVLDEFAFHRDAEAIWRAAFATATRGFQLEIISTPNGARGKYYELARAAGLLDYAPPAGMPELRGETFPQKGSPRTPSKDSYRNASEPARGAAAFQARVPAGRGHLPGKRPPNSSRSQPNGPQRNADTEFQSADSLPNPPTHAGVPSEVAPPPPAAGSSPPLWSAHWVDIHHARAHGFVVDVESLRAAIADEDAWQQEYCCRFLAQAAHYIPPEMVVAAEHPAATTTLRSEGGALSRPCYLGVDIGRRRDLTVLWLLEVEDELAPPEARRYLTRAVLTLDRQPFARQRRALDALLSLRLTAEPELRENPPAKGVPYGRGFAVRQCALDATGLGLMLAEELQARWGQRVEPVTFTLPVKEDLAVRVKRVLEESRLKIPYDPAVRAALGAVKRYVTPAGNIRFDAERTDRSPHADHFWALALALAAAGDSGPSVDFISTSLLRPSAQSMAF